MDAREASGVIDADAAAWAVRLDDARDDARVAAAAEAWAAADPRRRGALLRAQAGWQAMLDDAAVPVAEARPTRRRVFALAAGLAAIAAGGAGVWIAVDRDEALATGIGEQRRQRLADGSTILLNTASRSRVAMSAHARRVVLDDGEAWFQVAKDKARPFIVQAGAVRVVAVGTAFSVRRLADRAEVVVTEGRVRVWSVDNPARFLTLAAGRRAVVGEATGADAATITEGGVDQALAWRRGEIVLDGMTLGDAAAEFNRYNRRQLSVEAPLADRRIVGWFRTDDLDGFARSAAAMTGARIERDESAIRIVE